MSNLTVCTYVHEGHKQWIPSWVNELNRQSLDEFDVLLILHNWSSGDEVTKITKYVRDNLRYSISNVDIMPFNNGEKLIGKNINFACDFISTDYFAQFDVDDMMHIDRLRDQLRFLRMNNMVDFCGTRGLGFHGDKPPDNFTPMHHDTSSELLKYLDEPTLWDTAKIKECMLVKGYNCLPHGSMIFKTDAIEKIGGFDLSDVKVNGLSPDFETWKKALRVGMQFARLPELYYYWRQGSSVIRN